MISGPFATQADVASVGNKGERYVPLVDPYNAAMHLGHMASYKHALRYAYRRCMLDIGCGTGYGTHYLASFSASQVFAVDVDLVALDYARAAYAHSRIHYQCSYGERLPFADATFELVFSSQVIEHAANPEYFLAEIKRVLKPGGFCLVTTPNKELFSPDRAEGSTGFHINEMSLAQFEAIGRAVFPHVEMAGIPQNSLVRQPDGKTRLKANHLLRLEDYQVRRDDLTRCENMLLFGHTQLNGEFSATLPDSLSRASTSLAPCFWDAAAGQWIDLGLYPATNEMDRQTRNDQQAVQKRFHSPRNNLFRIDVALKNEGAMPIEIKLRDCSSSGPLLAHVAVRPARRRLSLVFEPIADSSGREFYLELRPQRNLLDTLLHRNDILPQFEYRGGQLAFWTFHQTLPPVHSS